MASSAIADAWWPSAGRRKAGSTSARSRSPTASKARRPWGTKSPSKWIGSCRARFSIPPAAAGLRVPKPLGDFLVLQAVRQSGGTAIAVSDDALMEAGVRLAAEEGIYAAPEGAACVAALEKLLASGFLKSTDRIVLYNTGSGLKYPEAYSARFPR